jgi:hypothetical protein
MTRRSRIVRIVAIALGTLLLAASGGLLAASSKTSAKLRRQFASHAIEVPVPSPLTQAELTALRIERAAADGGEPGEHTLQGVDLAALAAKRASERGNYPNRPSNRPVSCRNVTVSRPLSAVHVAKNVCHCSLETKPP